MATLEELAEQFLEEYRKGTYPSVERYAKEYPELAEDIRALFPTLRLLERGGQRDVLSSVTKFGMGQGQPVKCPPQILQYRVVREIGKGGMGIVYEAHDETLDRTVALKILRTFHGEEEQAAKRFRREAKMAAQLHHTNIVPVFGSGTFDGTFFYVMQYINGISIDQLVSDFILQKELGAEERDSAFRRVPLDFPALFRRLKYNEDSDSAHIHSFTAYCRLVARVGAEVAAALDYAHRHEILHRDIKPSNILLDEQGTVWVTDFGLAKPIGETDLTQQGQIIGTLRYLSPEGLEGEFTPQSDIFSLGLTLYEMLTLTPAFGETNYSRLLGQVSASQFQPPRKVNPLIPKDLETIILKATARYPTKRYQSGGDLADDLTRFLEERPIRARRSSVLEQGWRWCRRNKLSASLLGLSLLLLVLLTTGSWTAYFHARSLLADKDRESRRAQTNLDLALAAFDDIFASFRKGDNQILSRDEASFSFLTPDTIVTEKEAAVLESLLSFYDRFAQENSQDQQLLMESARAYGKIALLRLRLGRTDDSLIAFTSAMELYRRSAKVDPTPIPFLLEETQLVACFMADLSGPRLGDSRLGPIVSDQIERLEQVPLDNSFQRDKNQNLYRLYFYRAFLKLNEFFDRELKQNDDLKKVFNIRHAFSRLGKVQATKQAIESDLHRSRVIMDGMLAAFPDDPDLLMDRARSCGFSSLMAAVDGRRDESQSLFDQAFQTVEALAERFPDAPAYKNFMIHLYYVQSYVVQTDGRTTARDELEPMTKANDVANELAEKFPNLPVYAKNRVLTEFSLARAMEAAGEPDEADRLFQLAIKHLRQFVVEFPYFKDFQTFPPLYSQYALFLIARDRYDEAEVQIETLNAWYRDEVAPQNDPHLDEMWLTRIDSLNASLKKARSAPLEGKRL
ncbi:MAG: serine/threonine-protein kinase [Planctomycetia bacterium]|nr:serine/threonine-protein kinase [Planctomycetia bacterium]